MSLINLTPLKPAKRVRQEITAADFYRILDRTPVCREPYVQRSIYPSSLFEKPVLDFVLGYFFPTPSCDDWKMEMYTGHGKAAERVIQERLFYAGLLDCPYRTFQETTVYCAETGISGRLDGILKIEAAKAFGAVNEQAIPAESRRAILEIKETNDFGFGKITSPDDIPEKFQWAQTAYQKIMGIPLTCFLYVNRDSMLLKPMFYEGTDEIWEKIQKKCREIWRCINSRIIPLAEGEISVEDYAKRAIDSPVSESYNAAQ